MYISFSCTSNFEVGNGTESIRIESLQHTTAFRRVCPKCNCIRNCKLVSDGHGSQVDLSRMITWSAGWFDCLHCYKHINACSISTGKPIYAVLQAMQLQNTSIITFRGNYPV